MNDLGVSEVTKYCIYFDECCLVRAHASQFETERKTGVKLIHQHQVGDSQQLFTQDSYTYTHKQTVFNCSCFL